MSTIDYTYFIYIAISAALTVWVGRSLHRGGRVFLVDVFHGNVELADSVNRLLIVGFYLINFGYVVLALKITDSVQGAQQAIEALSGKVGLVLLVLGGMHFLNLYVFTRLRRRATLPARPAVQPDAWTTPNPYAGPVGQLP
jgi:hypothetical protein